MIAEVKDFDNRGRGLIRAEGKLFPVDGVIPGEKVELEMIRNRPVLKRIIEGSEFRREPSCRLGAMCPGCPWAHITRKGQASFRARAVARAVGMEVRETWQGPGTGWRWRSRFALKRLGTTVYLGFPQGRGMIFDLWDCPALPGSQRGLLERVKRFFKEERVSFYDPVAGKGKLVALGLYGSPQPENLVLSLITRAPVRSRLLGERIAGLSPTITGVAEECGSKAWGLYGEHHYFHRIGSRVHRMTPGQPWPQNPFLHEALIALIRNILLRGERVLEAGTGYFLGLHIADISRSVLLVDRDPGRLADPISSLRISAGPNLEITVDNLCDVDGDFRVFLVNADRERVSKKAVKNMSKAEQIVVISQDMKALERSHGNLTGAGFRPARALALEPAPDAPGVLGVVEYVREKQNSQ